MNSAYKKPITDDMYAGGADGGKTVVVACRVGLALPHVEQSSVDVCLGCCCLPSPDDAPFGGDHRRRHFTHDSSCCCDAGVRPDRREIVVKSTACPCKVWKMRLYNMHNPARLTTIRETITASKCATRETTREKRTGTRS